MSRLLINQPLKSIHSYANGDADGADRSTCITISLLGHGLHPKQNYTVSSLFVMISKIHGIEGSLRVNNPKVLSGDS